MFLDMDSSESPTHGDQEGSTYNGHFGCTCYHPLFCFNQFGELERSLLRPGNVHSAEDWRLVLEPVVERYRNRDLRRYRYDDWKMTFMEQWATGTFLVWANPFTPLRVPLLFHLQRDPYSTSNRSHHRLASRWIATNMARATYFEGD